MAKIALKGIVDCWCGANHVGNILNYHQRKVRE